MNGTTIAERTEQWAYETFARAYPIEAYDMDKKRFIEFMHKEGYEELSEEEIDRLIELTRSGESGLTLNKPLYNGTKNTIRKESAR